MYTNIYQPLHHGATVVRIIWLAVNFELLPVMSEQSDSEQHLLFKERFHVHLNSCILAGHLNIIMAYLPSCPSALISLPAVYISGGIGGHFSDRYHTYLPRKVAVKSPQVIACFLHHCMQNYLQCWTLCRSETHPKQYKFKPAGQQTS